jgi:hypothetical protein
MAKISILFLLGLISLSVFTNASSHLAHHRSHTHAANTYIYFVGDFNGDDYTDILRQKAGGWASDPAELFLSNGRGVFQKLTLPSNFDLNGDLTNLYIGDFNGDDNDDILRQEKGAWVANGDRVNTAYLLLSNGDGTFQKTVLNEAFDLNGDLTNLYIGDFNGDGRDDVLRQEKGAWTANNDRVNTAYLLISKGNDFTKYVLDEDLYLNGDYTNLYVGDFNADGNDDVLRQEHGAWAGDDVNMATLLISTGTGFRQTSLPSNFDLNGDLTTLTVGDFNGDGYADVLRREKGSWATDRVNTAYLLISNGSGFNKIVLDENLNFPATYTNVYVGDFNSDGKADLIRQEKGAWATSDTVDTTQILLSTGSGFNKVAYPHDTEMNGDVSTLYVGDFNADKYPDFLQVWGLDAHFVHYNQGDSTFF